MPEAGNRIHHVEFVIGEAVASRVNCASEQPFTCLVFMWCITGKIRVSRQQNDPVFLYCFRILSRLA